MRTRDQGVKAKIKADLMKIMKDLQRSRMEDSKEYFEHARNLYRQTIIFSFGTLAVVLAMVWKYYPSRVGFFYLFFWPLTFYAVYTTRKSYLECKRDYDLMLIQSVIDE